MKKWLGVIALTALLLGGVTYLVITRLLPQLLPHPSMPTPAEYTTVDVGLSQEESTHLHHIYQGTKLFPLAFLYSLRNVETGKMMSDSLPDYGFLMEGVSEQNPYGLPVGIAATTDNFHGLKSIQVGLNCTACHTGEFEYQGKRLRIDGAPNLIDVESWTTATAASAQAILTNPEEAVEFFARFISYTYQQASWPADSTSDHGTHYGLDNDTIDDIEDLADCYDTNNNFHEHGHDIPEDEKAELKELHEALHEAHSHVNTTAAEPESLELPTPNEDPEEASVATFKHVLYLLKEKLAIANKTIDAIKRSPNAGPGRDDAWNLIGLRVMDDQYAVLDTPISVPHLFDMGDFKKFHCDGNTTSVMDRNIAQGIALGASVLEDGVTTTVDARAIREVNLLLDKIRSPEWPEAYPPINEELAARGEELYLARSYEYQEADKDTPTAYSCADCHSNTRSRLSTQHYDFDVKQVGTNSKRWSMYNGENGKAELAALAKKVEASKVATMKAQNIPAEEYNSWEITDNPSWASLNGTKGYIARDLAGIWASPPYLHNGSVRTLYQLLLPEEKRETSFHTGSREFDPKNIGYLNKAVEQKGIKPYVLDTTKPSDANKGHLYGTELSDEDRYALIEYLKTL